MIIFSDCSVNRKGNKWKDPLLFLHTHINAAHYGYKNYSHFLRLIYWYKWHDITEKNIANFHINILYKYHWFSMNSFWPPGLRPSLCDVHNSLNTDPLLLLSAGGQANSVKSKIISTPINNQLQNCCLSDRPEKPKKEVAI